MIFQEPATAFDPVFTIGHQIAETVQRHTGKCEADAWKRARELLEMVRIPSPAQRLKAYPHEMSGGMRQRAMIALALSCNPSLLLADEPTTALDATVQIQVLLLIRELQRELDLGVIFVTHDIGVAVEVSDRIGVMYAGKLVELGGGRADGRCAAASLHARPARLDGAWRHARPAARGDSGRAARSRRGADRLQLRAALQVRQARVHGSPARPAGDGRGPSGALRAGGLSAGRATPWRDHVFRTAEPRGSLMAIETLSGDMSYERALEARAPSEVNRRRTSPSPC